MTCSEIHAYLGNDPRAAASDLAHELPELSEHIAKCSLCNRFIEERKEVAKCLHLMRDCAPAIPASLDTSVLSIYRSYISEQSRSAASFARASRINLRAAFSWTAAVAFAVVVAYGAMLLLSPDQGGGVRQAFPEPQPLFAPKAVAGADKLMAAARGPVREKPKSTAASAKHTNPETSATQQDNSLPTRFQSLMYCDPLSCPRAMDVIRVQLPSPVLGRSSVSSTGEGVVQADVLVGPDGIARGIRVVE